MKSISFSNRALNIRVKALIIALLLIPSLLFSQEQESKPGPDIVVHIFDVRCISPLEWSVSLIQARRDGVTIDIIIKRLIQNYTTGPLRGYQPETIEYMLTIISAVFSADTVYEEGVFVILHEVEDICVTYIENIKKQEKANEESISV